MTFLSPSCPLKPWRYCEHLRHNARSSGRFQRTLHTDPKIINASTDQKEWPGCAKRMPCRDHFGSIRGRFRGQFAVSVSLFPPIHQSGVILYHAIIPVARWFTEYQRDLKNGKSVFLATMAVQVMPFWFNKILKSRNVGVHPPVAVLSSLQVWFPAESIPL